MDKNPTTDRVRAVIDVLAKAAQGDRSARVDSSKMKGDLARLADAVNGLLDHVLQRHEDSLKAQEALAQEQHLMNFLMDVVTDHIYFKDRESRFLRIGKEMAKRFGMQDPSQALGKTDFDVFSDEHARQAYNDEQEIVRTGRPLVDFEEKETWPDGRETWVSTTKMPLRDPDGNVVGIFGISRDVTERKRVTDELRASEEKVRSILRAAPTGVGMIVGQSFVEVNDRVCEMTGYSREELLGSTARMFHETEEEYLGVARENMVGIRKTGTSTIETRWRRKDGSAIDVLLNTTPLDPAERRKGITFTALDITKRKRTERELRRRVEFESLVSRISASFVEPADLDAKIDDALKSIGAFCGADRAYVFQLRDDATADNTHEWCAEGIEPHMHRLQGIDLANEMPWFWKRVRALEDFCVPSIRDLPAEARKEKSHFEEQSIRSLVAVPMVFERVLAGFIGFDRVREEKAWTDDTISLLRFAGETIARALERKQADKALRESRQMLQTVLDTIPVRVFWKDRDSNYLGANKWFLEDAGLASVDELIGKDDSRMVWSKFADLYRKDDVEVIESGVPKLFFEEPYQTADGQSLWLRTSKVPLRDASGEIKGLLGFLEDITESKRMEDALRLTQFCFDQASVAILLVGPDGKVVKGNDAACRSLGYTQEELDGLSGLEIDFRLQPEDWEEHRRLLRIRGSTTHERAYRRKDGSEFPVAVTVSYIEFQDQGFAFSFFTDLTERKRMEDALRMTQFCVDRASVAIFLVGPDGKVMSVNDHACQLLGYTRDELSGMSSYEIDAGLPGEDWTEHRRLLRSEGSVTRETFYRRQDGTEFPVEVTTTYVEYQGQEFGFSFLTDLTERKRAEEEKAKLEARLAHSQRMECVGRLAGGVAHDFNNMLSVILGYSELLESGLADDSPFLEDVKQIEKAAGRSRDITRQLLAFSRKQIISPKPVNLNDLIRDTQATLARLIGEDVDLRFHPEENLWKTNLDNSQFDQILMNLAVNARDAMPNGGVLTVETTNVHVDELYCRRHPNFAPGQYVLLAVSDTGIGMDKETLSHLFEPFFTTKETGKGTGLGLATVYGIVSQNNGLIDVYSEPGRGTTFRIHFPRVVKEDDAIEEPDATLVASGSGTVLLVEDDEMVRRLTAKMLETIGYTVLVAKTPDDAMAWCEQADTPIDLLITDVVMPTMNGADLRDRAVVARPGIRVLFMSGYTSNVIVHHGVLEEGVNFVQKPFTMRDLARKIQDAMRTG